MQMQVIMSVLTPSMVHHPIDDNVNIKDKDILPAYDVVPFAADQIASVLSVLNPP